MGEVDGADELFRVVVADDLEELRLLVRLTLERSGHFAVVGEAGNGHEAVEAVRSSAPDLVLLDISMPLMDGFEALPLIRATAPSARVVMLSGFSEHRLGEAARAGGAVAYVEKGIPPRELVKRLLDVMESPAPVTP